MQTLEIHKMNQNNNLLTQRRLASIETFYNPFNTSPPIKKIKEKIAYTTRKKMQKNLKIQNRNLQLIQNVNSNLTNRTSSIYQNDYDQFNNNPTSNFSITNYNPLSNRKDYINNMNMKHNRIITENFIDKTTSTNNEKLPKTPKFPFLHSRRILNLKPTKKRFLNRELFLNNKNIEHVKDLNMAINNSNFKNAEQNNSIIKEDNIVRQVDVNINKLMNKTVETDNIFNKYKFRGIDENSICQTHCIDNNYIIKNLKENNKTNYLTELTIFQKLIEKNKENIIYNLQKRKKPNFGLKNFYFEQAMSNIFKKIEILNLKNSMIKEDLVLNLLTNECINIEKEVSHLINRKCKIKNYSEFKEDINNDNKPNIFFPLINTVYGCKNLCCKFDKDLFDGKGISPKKNKGKRKNMHIKLVASFDSECDIEKRGKKRLLEMLIENKDNYKAGTYVSSSVNYYSNDDIYSGDGTDSINFSPEKNKNNNFYTVYDKISFKTYKKYLENYNFYNGVIQINNGINYNGNNENMINLNNSRNESDAGLISQTQNNFKKENRDVRKKIYESKKVQSRLSGTNLPIVKKEENGRGGKNMKLVKNNQPPFKENKNFNTNNRKYKKYSSKKISITKSRISEKMINKTISKDNKSSSKIYNDKSNEEKNVKKSKKKELEKNNIELLPKTNIALKDFIKNQGKSSSKKASQKDIKDKSKGKNSINATRRSTIKVIKTKESNEKTIKDKDKNTSKNKRNSIKINSRNINKNNKNNKNDKDTENYKSGSEENMTGTLDKKMENEKQDKSYLISSQEKKYNSPIKTPMSPKEKSLSPVSPNNQNFINDIPLNDKENKNQNDNKKNSIENINSPSGNDDNHNSFPESEEDSESEEVKDKGKHKRRTSILGHGNSPGNSSEESQDLQPGSQQKVAASIVNFFDDNGINKNISNAEMEELMKDENFKESINQIKNQLVSSGMGKELLDEKELSRLSGGELLKYLLRQKEKLIEKTNKNNNIGLSNLITNMPKMKMKYGNRRARNSINTSNLFRSKGININKKVNVRYSIVLKEKKTEPLLENPIQFLESIKKCKVKGFQIEQELKYQIFNTKDDKAKERFSEFMKQIGDIHNNITSNNDVVEEDYEAINKQIGNLTEARETEERINNFIFNCDRELNFKNAKRQHYLNKMQIIDQAATFSIEKFKLRNRNKKPTVKLSAKINEEEEMENIKIDHHVSKKISENKTNFNANS